ncbi:glucose-6-phosphate isomerase family protein [uncultured Methanoregula sp.]|uniref:glucose-6-phosphate isomerase family protein n=1 Tax=uncultured Methanoregula sp. TaxID=1005933 RepID=UPI002AAB9DFC|nr:glucose-6-phosphate isomerase family protein [uncultured Methanoregula sp.]
MTIKSPHPDKMLRMDMHPASWEHPLPSPVIRYAEDLWAVLADPACECTGPVYHMYRGVNSSPEDRRWMEEQQIRFDITVIPPRELCGEFIKTKGHYHPDDPDGAGYPEIYEVLAGEAHYLIQTRDCSDIVMISARAGDVVVVPSGYGHVTINPSRDSVLEMANLVSSRFSSDYLGYESRHGAAYFEMADGEFVKNPAYPEHTTLRLVRAQRLSDVSDAIPDPLYDLVRKRDPLLEFLNYPEKHEALFRDLYP